MTKEYSYRYNEDNEGHPSIEILLDGNCETDFEKSWVSMHLKVKSLTLTKSLRSEPNETDSQIIEESSTERLSGEASLGEDSIGLIYTKRKTSKIEITFYEDKAVSTTSQSANKYYLSGYSDDDERGKDSPPGTYFLVIFLCSSRFNELKELVLNHAIGELYVSVRTGVLPNLYNEFTTGDWPTVYRYLENSNLLDNPEDVPDKVSAKGVVRKGGYECEITFSRLPTFRATTDSKESDDSQRDYHESDADIFDEQKSRMEIYDTDTLNSRRSVKIDLSKVALPIWVFAIIYALSHFLG